MWAVFTIAKDIGMDLWWNSWRENFENNRIFVYLWIYADKCHKFGWELAPKYNKINPQKPFDKKNAKGESACKSFRTFKHNSGQIWLSISDIRTWFYNNYYQNMGLNCVSTAKGQGRKRPVQ